MTAEKLKYDLSKLLKCEKRRAKKKLKRREMQGMWWRDMKSQFMDNQCSWREELNKRMKIPFLETLSWEKKTFLDRK